MSRVLVSGSYSATGAFELRHAEGILTGELLTVIEPNTVFSVGNSIGGYYARQVMYTGQRMIAAVRVSGGQKSLSAQQLASITKGGKGFILKPGLGLWAISSGSAKRGLFHKYTPPTDPIEVALVKVGLGRSVLRLVSEIKEIQVQQGGRLCGHQTSRGRGFASRYDGEVAQTVVEPTYCEEHDNQYHIGCGETPGTYLVSGGTYALEWSTWQCMNGCWAKQLSAVYVTPGADKEFVGAFIQAGPDNTEQSVRHWLEKSQRTAAVEAEFGSKAAFFAAALQDEALAARYVATFFLVKATEKGTRIELSFDSKPQEDWQPNFRLAKGEVAELLLAQAGLSGRLVEAADQRDTWITSGRRRLEGETWEILTDSCRQTWETFCSKAEGIYISLNDKAVRDAVFCLSYDVPGGQKRLALLNGFVPGSASAALSWPREALLPVPVGETRHFLMEVKEYDSLPEAAVWGLSVTNTAAGPVFGPYDNGLRYRQTQPLYGVCARQIATPVTEATSMSAV